MGYSAFAITRADNGYSIGNGDARMPKVTDVAELISTYIPTEARPGVLYYVRCRIGSGPKSSAKVWKYRPYVIEPGANPVKMAQEVFSRLDTERLEKRARAWVDVVEVGDSNPTQTLHEPIDLDPMEDSDGDGEGSGDVFAGMKGGKGLAALVGSVMHATVEDKKATLRFASDELSDHRARIAHLETTVSAQHKTITEQAVQLAEAKARLVLSAGDNGMMAEALKPFLERVAEAAPELLDKLPSVLNAWSGQKPAAPPKPEAAKDGDPKPEPTPGEELDTYMEATAYILSQDYSLLTPERYRKFCKAFEQICMLAHAKGYPPPDKA
jgi:uncharacterized coiled-coil protein SlyX